MSTSGVHRQVLCGDCDGVGWIEGGPELQTRCAACGGRGAICCDRQRDDPIHRPAPSPAPHFDPMARVHGIPIGTVTAEDVDRFGVFPELDALGFGQLDPDVQG